MTSSPMIGSMEQLKHTAYHEAGHAVIGLVLGYGVRKATIRQRYSYLGSAWISKRRHSSSGSTEVQAVDVSPDSDDFGHICIDLAGPLAEQLVNPVPFEELINHGARGDWPSARKHARRINRQHADILIVVLMEETRALVQQHREAIGRVAAALLEHETLTADDIKRLTNGSGS
jgi:ATP-dependent Zn protease